MVDFYKKLESFTKFEDVTNPGNFVSAPRDWYVVLTDIKGSTAAIAAGRYQDVNTSGAASITAALNAVQGVDIPYVFGGDGASLLIPPESVAGVKEALVKTKVLVQKLYGLDLRVGFVPVHEVHNSGAQILVAKYELSPGNRLAMFTGGGLAEAERLVKTGTNYLVEVSEASNEAPDLKGLSCRWKPIHSQFGTMISVLVVLRSGTPVTVLRQIIAELSDSVGDTRAAAPIQEANANPMFTLRKIWKEAGMKGTGPGQTLRFPMVFLVTVILAICFRFKIPLGPFNTKKYFGELLANADFRKFDDALRMVLDVSKEQVTRIRTVLDKHHAKKEIFYGLHESGEALMTCLVFSATGGQHIHFIDGGDGGYTAAAKQLKEQIKNAQKPVTH